MIPRLLPLLLLAPFAGAAGTRVDWSGDRSIPAIAFAADLVLARQWQAGSVPPAVPRGGTEKGFRK